MLGVDAVEAIRNHQKVADLRPSGATNPTTIAATGSLVAIGFGVSPCMPGVVLCSPHLSSPPSIFFLFCVSLLVYRIRRFGSMTGMARRSRRLAY